MADIVSLTYEVDSRDIRQADDALDDMAVSADKAGKEVDDFGRSTKKAGASARQYTTSVRRARTATSGIGRQAGQAGIQIQQFVGQVQAGTAASVALSQQAADLGIVLGAPLVGVAVSLGAVLAGTLAKALGNVEEEIDRVAIAAKTLDRVFKDVTMETDDLSDSLQELARESRQAFEVALQGAIIESQQAIEQLRSEMTGLVSETLGDNELQALANFRKAIGDVDTEVGYLDDSFNGLNVSAQVNKYRRDIVGLADDMGITALQADELVRSVIKFNSGDITALQLQAVTDSMGLQSEESTTLANKLRTLTDQVALYKQQIEELQGAQESSSQQSGQSDFYTPPAFQPWRVGIPEPELVNEWITRVTTERNERLRQDWLATKDRPWYIGVPDPETLDAALEAMDERIDRARQERLDKDRDAAEERKQIEQEYFNVAASLFNSAASAAVEASERKADADLRTAEAAVQAAENGTEAEKQAARAQMDQARQSFEVQKKLNSGLILANTAVGVTNALKFGAPGVKWVEAAAVAAEGTRQLLANEASEFGGGSAPSAPAPPAEITNNNTNTTQTNITITGGVGFGIEELRELFADDVVLYNQDSAQARVRAQ